MSRSRVKLGLLFAVISATLLFNKPIAAQTFTQQTYSAATPNAGSLASADMNHDGFPDVINAGGTDVFVLINNGDGTFAAPVPYSVGSGNIINTAVADVNGDTHPDVIVSYGDPSSDVHIAILYGNGDGTLRTPVELSQTFPGYVGFAIADFNRDGRPDLVAAFVENGVNRMTVLFGDGVSFSNPLEFSGFGKVPDPGENNYFLAAVAAGDFNGDGNPDIAIGQSGGGFDVPAGSFSVFYGKGNGTFGPEVFEGGESGLFNIQTVNANNDGIDDLAVFFSGCHTPCQGIDIEMGDPSGLGHKVRAQVPPFDGSDVGTPSAIVFADVNGDGRPDVIAAGLESHDDINSVPAISVNVQQPDGTFTRAALLQTSIVASDLLAGDFNRDGEWDFISSDGSESSISVFTNTTAGIGCAYPSSNRTINVCTPQSGATVTSPVLFRANPRSNTEISGMKIYVDGTAKFLTKDAPLTANLIITPGTHKITVKAWDASGPFSNTFTLTSGGDSGSCQPASNDRAVTICTPIATEWQPTSVHITANANGTNVRTAQIYIDGTLKYSTQNFAIDTQLSLTPGTHRLTVKGWDDLGSFITSINVSVYGGSCKPAVATDGRGLTVCSPRSGVPYDNLSTVPLQAVVVSPNKISSFTWSVNNSAPQTIDQSWLDIGVTGGPGYETFNFQATDSQGTMSQTIKILVTNASCPAPSTRTVVICSPSNGQTVNGSFVLEASAGDPSGTLKALQIYKDGSIWFTTNSPYFEIDTGLSPGTHRITAKAWDASGQYSTTINVTSP